ncbi:MAG: STAS domain-containing protein [Deltaproteobacteria bacterium]|nr:STAS domain-containing protein [Deltaproteobacteria bacterium]
MDVNGYKQDKFFIVRVSGRMDATTAPEFEKSCLEWIGQGESMLIVDLKDLEYMSSAGLRSILIVGKKIKSAGGTLSFSSLTPNVEHVFSISGFGSMFKIHDSLEKALQN